MQTSNASIVDMERKITEIEHKITESKNKIVELERKIVESENKLNTILTLSQLSKDATMSDIILKINKITSSVKRRI